MEVSIQFEGDTLTATLCSEIDHHTAAICRSKIDTAVEKERPKRLVLDFGSVMFMDSSGIGLIMGRWRLMKSLGAELEVKNVPPHLAKLMRLSGVEQITSIGCQEETK